MPDDERLRIDKWLWAGAPDSLATESPGLGSPVGVAWGGVESLSVWIP